MNKEKIGIFCPICKGEKLITSNLGEVYCVDCKKKVMNFRKISTLIALNTDYDILKENQNQKAIECLKEVKEKCNEIDYFDSPDYYDNEYATWGHTYALIQVEKIIDNKIKELEKQDE